MPGIAGASRETLEALPNVDPRGIAVDNLNGRIDYSSGFSIKCANLDGAGATTILTASSGIGDVEVDPVGGKLYYSTIFAAPTDGIWSAALDGSGATLLHDAVTLASGAPVRWPSTLPAMTSISGWATRSTRGHSTAAGWSVARS